MYGIQIDHDRRIVSGHLSGFFTREEVAAFARDEQAAAASLTSGPFGLLLETPGAMVQSQEVVTAFRSLFSDLPLKASWIAIVTDSALLTMQLRRMVDPARTRVFDRADAALAWLGEKASDAATRPDKGEAA